MSGRGYNGVVASVDPIKKATHTIAELAKTAQMDLFNRLKVALPNSQFTYQNEYSKGERQWVEKVVGTASATHDPLNAAVDLTVSAANSTIIRQTRRYFRYSSGKTLSTILTYDCPALVQGAGFRTGYFDNDNGGFLEYRLDGQYVALRRNGVTEYIHRSDWNVDKLDGAGRSKVNYDFTKSTIFPMNLQWLGVGTVQIAIESANGEILPVHQFHHSGVINGTYMRTANLPIRYEVFTDETFSGTFTVKQICAAVSTEDGIGGEISAYEHGIANGITPVAVTTRRCVLAVRPKLTYGGLPNRADARIREIELIAGGNDSYWELVYAPTFGGTPTWNSVNDDSTLEYSTNATTITGGVVVRSGYVTTGGGQVKNQVSRNVSSNYPMALDVDGANPIAYALVCTSFTGTSNINSSVGLQEIY